MASKIPDRWLNYRPIGDRVEGTRFIAFKVPLREIINKNVNEKNRLYAKLLLDKVPNLGVIIDLTNTNRYYDPDFFKNKGVEHIKIMIPGHATPPPRLVNRFKEFVNQYIQKNPDNDKLIGVHCTHGVNRTGYLICNYMVSEMAIDPKEAIKKFGRARGHSIERKNYVDSLKTLKSVNVPEEVKHNNDDKNIGPQIIEKRASHESIIERAANDGQNDLQVHEMDRSRNWRHRESKIEHRNERRTERFLPYQRKYNAGNYRNDPTKSSSRHTDRNTNPNRFQWRRDAEIKPNTFKRLPSIPMPAPVVPLTVVERCRRAFDDDIIQPPSNHHANRYNNTYGRFNSNFSNERYSRDNRSCHNDYGTRDSNYKRRSHLSHPSTSIRTDYSKDSRTNSQHHRHRSSSRHHQ